MNYANISDCGKYRYELGRRWSMSPNPSLCMWVMLNPSTADANIDDPTIGRCIEFSKAWGFDGLLVGNVYSYRTAYPQELWKARKEGVDIFGQERAAHLNFMAARASRIVCAWGSKADHNDAKDVFLSLRDVNFGAMCYLVRNKDGQPKHPLYIKGDTVPTFYSKSIS